MPFAVLAHPGQPLLPHDLWSAWTLAPAILVPLELTLFVYLLGLQRIWQRAGAGHGLARRHWLCFMGAMLALAVALVSPLDALSGVLFSAHMAQHLLLMLVAAPLLVLSDWPLALLWALPRRWASALGRRWRRVPAVARAGKVVSRPLTGWLVFTLVLWGWHAPALYEAALRDTGLHALEHLSFLAAALLFWWVLLKPGGAPAARYGLAVPYLFTTALHSSILGALLTFTTQLWYPYYALLAPVWGLTPLQDQQLAGLSMWLPGGLVFTLLTIGYFAAWLRALEARSGRRPQRSPDQWPAGGVAQEPHGAD